METRANRPVSMIIATSPLAVHRDILSRQPTKPCARDPPAIWSLRYQCFQRGPRRVCNRKTR
jgi:hypothetical protein